MTGTRPFVERITHVMGRRGLLARPLAVLVVDRPSIANPRLTVQDDRLAGPLDQELVGDMVPLVLEQGKLDPMRPRVFDQLGGGLLGV